LTIFGRWILIGGTSLILAVSCRSERELPRTVDAIAASTDCNELADVFQTEEALAARSEGPDAADEHRNLSLAAALRAEELDCSWV
jgi:hypothetical protein